MSAPYDRPTDQPGGCECFACGIIFVGAEHHIECAVCLAKARAAKEIGLLANKMLELAPVAGLHVGIKIKPAKVQS